MMDITKSREELEAWFKSEFIVPASSLTLSPETFKNVVQKAYQAGRESIEMELPERAKLERSGKNKGRYVCGRCSFDPEYALGINHTIDWFVEALRTAGIRIKGESE
ncbi:Uncharacterised protein [Yersinia frederiksenii]|nr:Uncharacterised protein [Yersinia frederiksenii]